MSVNEKANGKNVKFNMELRDGFSRTGRLTLGEETYRTPCVLHFDAIKSLDVNTSVPLALKLVDGKKFEEMRIEHSGLSVFNAPLQSPKDFVHLVEEFVVKPTLSGSAKVFYAAGIATAHRIPVLAYFGFDVFDTILAEIAAETGVFMLDSGEVRVEELKENPCNCRVCSEYGEKVFDDKELLREHNISLMQARARLSRELIRSGGLRNFVESEVKHSPFFTAALRLFDAVWSEEHPYPRFKKSKAIFCSQESFSRPEVLYFLKRVAEVYSPKSKTAVVLPCSAKKPYLLSKTHRNLRRAVSFNGVNEIVVSSPLVTPRELELCYPANSYDVAVTGVWSEDEVNFVAERLATLIRKFEVVGGYVSGGYRRVFERACEIAGIDGTVLESVQELRRFVEENRGSGFSLYEEMFRHMSLYQFGLDLLEWCRDSTEDEGEKIRVRGRYPELELTGKKRLARMDFLRGMLDVYVPEFLMDAGYSVEIEEFKPRGTIFATGVVRADKKIKPSDLVAFYNDSWKGVGVARMSGVEMEKMEGYAVDVKRVFSR